MRLPRGAALLLAATFAGMAPDSATAVAVPESDCRVGFAFGADAAPGEEATARAACRSARAAFAELFGDSVPPVRLILWEKPGYRTGVKGDTAIVFWPVEHARGALPDDPAMLPHEIAHALVAARFFATDDGAAGDYGTPLPDWFEEALAIWAEPRSQRARRVEQARKLPPERRELSVILESPHPAAADVSILETRDGAPIPRDQALWDFYPRSIALLSFVFDRGGARAVRELAARLHADPDDRRALTGLPGLPHDEWGLRRSWHAWLVGERIPRYGL